MQIWDISEIVSPATAVFPGDTPFSAEWVMKMADGASCNVSTIRMSVHCGTHTDAPRHFDDAGLDIASVDLSIYCGPCRVVDLPGIGEPSMLPADEVARLAAASNVERLLFRTRPSHDPKVFDPTFTSVGPAAAKQLVESGVRLVGIDTPSIDPATCKELAGHHALHAGGVAILENIDLTGVEPGEYELIALPLKILDGDSSPVRAILRR